MRRKLRLLLLAALVTLVYAAGASADSLEQRVARLERVLQNQSLSGIVLQLERLQRELQMLRGQVEEQQYAMELMKKRQRDLYLDIDQRLGQLQLPSVPPSPKVSTVAPSAPEPVQPPAPVPAATAKIDPAQEESAYQGAFNLLSQGRYDEAKKAFRTFLANFPGGAYADNAQYWLAEANYVQRDFPVALQEFSQVVEAYPESPKVPDALLKTGFIHYEQGQWAEARQALESVKQRYPVSSAARLATQRLERMRAEGR
jgi:tol-pal system protein YbgF